MRWSSATSSNSMLLNTENILLGKLISWIAEHSIRLDGRHLARKGVDAAVDAIAVSASAIPCEAPPCRRAYPAAG